MQEIAVHTSLAYREYKEVLRCMVQKMQVKNDNQPHF